MTQLRRDYPKFQGLNAEVLVIVPNGPEMIRRHVNRHAPPYPILSDKGGRIAKQYGMNILGPVLMTAFKPGVFLVDKEGKIRYANYLASYVKVPDDREPLEVLARSTS